jgi:hypothetical protein
LDSPTPCYVRNYTLFQSSETPLEIKDVAKNIGQKMFYLPVPKGLATQVDFFLEIGPLLLLDWVSEIVREVSEELEPASSIQKGLPADFYPIPRQALFVFLSALNAI